MSSSVGGGGCGAAEGTCGGSCTGVDGGGGVGGGVLKVSPRPTLQVLSAHPISPPPIRTSTFPTGTPHRRAEGLASWGESRPGAFPTRAAACPSLLHMVPLKLAHCSNHHATLSPSLIVQGPVPGGSCCCLQTNGRGSWGLSGRRSLRIPAPT